MGWTPNYYLFGVPDGNVSGLALTVSAGGDAGPLHVAELSLRPGLPIQATLFRLCEHAEAALRGSGFAPESIRVGMTLLSDPALHGTVRAPDLRGLDPTRRALVAIEHDRSAWIFAPGRTADDLLTAARREL